MLSIIIVYLQRVQADTVRMRDRTNTMTTVASKKTVSAVKRPGGVGAVAQARQGSGGTRISSRNTSILIGMNAQQPTQIRPTKIITEVDGILLPKKLN